MRVKISLNDMSKFVFEVAAAKVIKKSSVHGRAPVAAWKRLDWIARTLGNHNNKNF